MIKVTLTPGEIKIAHYIASLRREANQAAGTRDARRDNTRKAIDLDILGAVSEIAWGKHWNRCPDLTINPRSGGADFTSSDGKQIDIKATDRKNGRLLAHPGKKKNDADVYVLAIVNEETVTFAGWATAEELLSPKTIIDLGHGPTHALDQSQLRPFGSSI